ncbi:MAG: hypothetical protein GY841_23405 [FCB group bacterium]|nr:hypothetical protein [FCB group bacterium]
MIRRQQRTIRPPACQRTLCVVILSVLILLCVANGVASAADNVAIIAIDQEPTTIRTIKGIKKAINRFDVEVAFHEAYLSGDQTADKQSLAALQDFNPSVFVTIGSYATEKIAEAFPQHPIIFANVINPQASGFVASMENPGGDITGASLDIPPEMQFKYLQKVVGSIKTIGVLYSSETENIIRQATVAATALGMTLIAVRVDSEKDIPRSIDSLCQVSDVLWSVADRKVYTPQSTRHIILQTLRNKVPLMGFSQSLVEAGGLFTLDFDFKDVGRQAGDIVVRVLHGSLPSQIKVTTPGIIYFKYNEKTAGQIQIEIPDELLAIAKEVIK